MGGWFYEGGRGNLGGSSSARAAILPTPYSLLVSADLTSFGGGAYRRGLHVFQSEPRRAARPRATHASADAITHAMGAYPNSAALRADAKRSGVL